MECGYLFEILHFLLEERLGTRWVKLLLDLQDVENEAALDLLSLLFKRCKSCIIVLSIIILWVVQVKLNLMI